MSAPLLYNFPFVHWQHCTSALQKFRLDETLLTKTDRIIIVCCILNVK